MAESIKTRFAYMPFADDGSQARKSAKGQNTNHGVVPFSDGTATVWLV